MRLELKERSLVVGYARKWIYVEKIPGSESNGLCPEMHSGSRNPVVGSQVSGSWTELEASQSSTWRELEAKRRVLCSNEI